MSNKDGTLSVILCCLGFIGIGGIHDFYLGKKNLAFIKLLTMNFLIVGTIIDLILLFNNEYKDCKGRFLSVRKENKNTKENNNNQNETLKNEEEKAFIICNLIKECNEKILKEIYDCQKYCGELDDDDFLNSMNIVSEIIGNEELKRWEFYYDEHGHHDLLGYIPHEYDDLMDDIINKNLLIYGSTKTDDELNINVYISYKKIKK